MNSVEKKKYLKKKADEGDVDQMLKYASLVYTGKGATINKSEAAKYFKMAADKGNSTAMFNYAIMLYKGDGIEVNKPMAARYFKMVADIGFTRAIFIYATILKNGEGVPVNKSEAINYYKLAINKGHTPSMYNYANMFLKGDGVDVNKSEAAKYFKMAADKGNSTAMFIYANMLLKGDGVDVNKSEAAKYFKMAADKGNARAEIMSSIQKSSNTQVAKKNDNLQMSKKDDNIQMNQKMDHFQKIKKDDNIQMSKKDDNIKMSKKDDNIKISKKDDNIQMSKKDDNIQMSKKDDNIKISKKDDNIQMSKKDDNIQMNQKIDHFQIIKEDRKIFDHFRKAFIQKDSHYMIKYATIIKNESYSSFKSSDEMQINSKIDLHNYVNLIYDKNFTINSNTIEFQQCIQQLYKIGALHPNQNQLTKLGLRMIPFYLIPPFVSSSILKVSDLYDFEISSIVGAIIYFIYSTENLYIKPITKSFCNNFCEDSDIITLTRTLFDIMTQRRNYEKAIIKSGFNPLKIKSIIKSITQMALMICDYNEDIIWEKLKQFFNKNNMMVFIQKIINKIEEIKYLWINLRKSKYNSIVKSSINYKFIYKNKNDITIKINQRPGGLGLATPGSCFIMQLQSNYNSKETIYYGSIIHRNISEEETKHPTNIQTSIIMNNIFATSLIDAYIGDFKELFEPFEITQSSDNDSNNPTFYIISQCFDKTIISYLAKEINDENAHILMNEAVKKVEKLIPFIPRTVLINKKELNAVAAITSYGSKNIASNVFKYTDSIPMPFEINQKSINYLINHISEMDNIDGSLVIAQTGENFIHSNDEPKLIGKTFAKIATSYVFEENMNHSHLIILSNKTIPDVKKLEWNKFYNRNCFQKNQSYDEIAIQTANKIFETFVEAKHEHTLIYCMKYDAVFDFDDELPEIYDEFYDDFMNNSQFNTKIENIFNLYSMNCIQNSQLVRDIGLSSIIISNSEINYKEIEKDLETLHIFKESHPNVNLITLIKEIPDDIKNLKNLKNQKHEYDNKIEEIEKKEKDQKDSSSNRCNGWGWGSCWGWGFGYSKSQYKSMSEKLENRISEAKKKMQLICKQNKINKNELKSVISIKYPINMLESDMKIGKTHLLIKVKSNEVNNLINSMRFNFITETIPLCSIIVSHHIRSCFSKSKFISKIKSICERFGGVVYNISDYQKYENNPINQGFIQITLYTCQFAIPFAGEVKKAFCDQDFTLLKIPSNIVYPILENHPAIIEAIDDWIEFQGLIFHKKDNKYYGSLNEIKKAQILFNQLKIPYKKFAIPKKMNLSKIEILINRFNAFSFKNCDELQWILDKSSGFIYIPKNCDKDILLKLRNNEEEFIYDYLLICEEEAMISKYPITLYQQNGSVRVSNFCLTCAYDLFANEVERFFDQKSDQPKMNLLLENVKLVKTIEMLPDLTNDSFWPEIPLGQMLMCLTSEPLLNSVVKTWFTAIVFHALHSSPLIQYCPDHPAILMQNNNKVIKCSQPGCKMYFCSDCKKWHKPAECKQKIKVPAGFRICPSCKRPVEKVAACNHIRCECGKHFCFYCGRGPADTEQQVYSHLNSEHNGHGNNPPDYRKYYLHQNVSDDELKRFYQKYPQLVPSKDFYIYFDS